MAAATDSHPRSASVFRSVCIIACGGEVVGAFVGCEGVDSLGDGLPKLFDGSGGGLAQQGLEAPDGLAKPHAHVMLTTREVVPEGPGAPGAFGKKDREWNSTDLLTDWRER